MENAHTGSLRARMTRPALVIRWTLNGAGSGSPVGFFAAMRLHPPGLPTPGWCIPIKRSSPSRNEARLAGANGPPSKSATFFGESQRSSGIPICVAAATWSSKLIKKPINAAALFSRHGHALMAFRKARQLFATGRIGEVIGQRSAFLSAGAPALRACHRWRYAAAAGSYLRSKWNGLTGRGLPSAVKKMIAH